MERFLDAYIERMRPYFPGFPGETAHEIASAFLAFKFGLYANAVRECTHAIALVPGGMPNEALRRALEIIRANAINLPADKVEDPGTLNLVNALILTYVVALITSPDDEEAMGEHRKLILRMLSDYKKELGLE